MPYLKNYTKILENDFDIIYWNQYNLDEQTGAMHQYQFNYEIPSNGTARARKALGYIKFRSFALKLIRRNNYDALIVLLTKTGFLFYRTLIKHFRNKFILDIRDYTAENNPLVYRFEKNLIECSGFTVISSPAYTHFLPNSEYVVSHNKTDVDSSLIQSYRINNHRKKEQITISCIGSIRFIDQFKKFIASFKGDNRFRIKFIGRGAEALEEFCKNNGFNNVTLIGRFESEDTTKYYIDTDIIMNLYGNGDPFLDYALSNKLYYAATFGMPILVCPNTYMEKVSVENGFGFTYDLEDKMMPNKLYEYYSNIDWDDFYNKCDLFMDNVNKDDNMFFDKFRQFFYSKEQSISCGDIS